MTNGLLPMTTARNDHSDVPQFVRDGEWTLAGAIGVRDGGGRVVHGPLDLTVTAGVIETVRALNEGEGQDRSGLVVMPLHVNAHDHGRGRGNVLAGIADAPLEEWIGSLTRYAGSTTQAALVGDAAELLLASGVGAAVICVNPQSSDVETEVTIAASAASRAGIRAAVVYPFADAMSDVAGRGRKATGYAADELERRFEAVTRLVESLEDPCIEIQLGPVGPQWVSEATLEAIAIFANARSLRIHMHLLESRRQRVWADATYPEGLLEYLDKIGLLGPKLCVAHGTNLRPDELDMLLSSGTVLALNSSSNLRLASGVPPIAAALKSDGAVGAGLDGLSLGDDGDYWNELRLLRGLGQAQSGEALHADALLNRLWSAGGKALGSSAPAMPREGAIADFQLVELGNYLHLVHQFGWSHAEVALAAGSPSRVREVWVGGRRVYTASDSTGTPSIHPPSFAQPVSPGGHGTP